MATTENIIIKQYNGTDYNTLYPQTTAANTLVASNLATILNETNSDEILNLYLTLLSNYKITEYLTAGSYTWSAPDLNNGSSYKIGVWMCGGGHGGSINLDDGGVPCGFGGGSGEDVNLVYTVTPNSIYNIVVGAGGTSSTATYTNGGTEVYVAGNSGGSTSAFGATALGGTRSHVYQESNNVSGCGQPPTLNSAMNPFGGNTIIYGSSAEYYYTVNSLCFNQFEKKKVLGAGGTGAMGDGSGNRTTPPGLNENGIGGGIGAYVHYPSTNRTVVAANATDNGCGGGGAASLVGISGVTVTAVSGAGGDGAVKIYYLGGN